MTSGTAEAEITLCRAAAGERGTHFIVPPDDKTHVCKPTCYRVTKWGVMFLCDAGHSAGAYMDRDRSWAGSHYEALCGSLPRNAPFVQVESEN